MIREAKIDDLATMIDIYNQAIQDRISSNCDVLQYEADGFKMTYFSTTSRGLALVSTASDGFTVTGWGAIKSFSGRPHEPGLGEVAVYIDRRYRGSGQGVRLLKALADTASKNGWSALVAVILGRNIASLRGCRACGFAEAVRLPSIAWVDERSEDIVWMHRFISRQGVSQ